MVRLSSCIRQRQCSASRPAGRCSEVSGSILRLGRDRLRVDGVLAHNPSPLQDVESAPHPHDRNVLRNLAALSRQFRRSWEHTPPQVGHGFLNLSFETLSCQGTGDAFQRVGSEAPIGLEVFPGHRGSLVRA